MFNEGFNPTPEEYAQAVIMTALFRKFGGKNKPSEVEINSKIPKTPSEILKDTPKKGLTKAEIKMHDEMSALVKDTATMNPKELVATREKLNDLGADNFMGGKVKE